MPRSSKKFTKQTVSPAIQKRWVQWLHAPVNQKPARVPTFTDDVNWRIFRIMAEFIEGFEFLSKLKNEVTIFGSARCKPSSKHYKSARELGRLLAKGGYAVITGGGPGIMEAANRGAFEHKGESVGLDIELPKGQRANPYVTHGIGFHYFFSRKVMLSASAQAYVFFPGGFGTLDEMTEMLTLIQTQKIPRNVPLILVDRAFWQPFLDWVNTTLLKEHHHVDPAEVRIIRVVDTPAEVMEIINQTSERPFG